MKSIFCLAVVLFAVTVKCQIMTQVVPTDKGPVRGRIFQTIWHSQPFSAFQGIPFAQPPVGSLRFKDPVEALPWIEVLNATRNKIICPQFWTVGPIGHEDCLYLNVFSPVTNFDSITTLKPVMVWIYGGGFTSGSALPIIYRPDFFLEEDVVFVSMNYRVSVLGFLALDVPGVSGNQGLKDQNLALQWVQKNIATFGGDPNQVTIFGESAGAASVGYHMISPRSQGLFHKAILQSSTPLCPWAFHTREEAIATAHELGDRMGFTTLNDADLLAFLEKANLKSLLTNAQFQGSQQSPGPISFPYVPTMTDDFLDDCPIAKFRNGEFSRVPILMGYNKDEFILFTAVLDSIRILLHDSLLAVANTAKSPPSILLADLLNKAVNGTEWEMIDLGTAFYFSGPVDMAQRYFAKYNRDQPVYFYDLAYESDNNLHLLFDSEINGTSHTDDLGLLFNIEIIYPTDPLDSYNLYRKKIVQLWTNFAKYSNPTPFNEPINGAIWEPSGTAGMQMLVNATNVMSPRLLNPMFQELEKLYDLALPLLTGCKPRPIALPDVYL